MNRMTEIPRPLQALDAALDADGWYQLPEIKEQDPHGRAPHEPGAKLDQGKTMAGLLLQFSRALQAVAEVCTHGANKYSIGGWQQVPEGEARYCHAEWRHKLVRAQGEDRDLDSGLLHQAHEAWCVLAQLELQLRAREERARDIRKHQTEAI